MGDVAILLHGVEADPALRLWNEEVAVRYQHLTSIRLMPRKYGYVGGTGVWFSASRRQKIVDHEEAYFRGITGQMPGLLEDIEQGTRISIIGHSLGAYIVTALLKRGIKFHCVAHLWGWTVPDFNWAGVDSNFERVRVYWSPNDERVSSAPAAIGEDPELTVGIMGKVGPQIAHPRVESIQTNWLHTQFMDFGVPRDLFWKDLFEWMAN